MEEPVTLPADPATALCSACGLCCDGTLFYSVVLQPGDSPRELIGLGLKLKKKKKQFQFLQPCSAFCGTHCSIYDHRPTRCRAFECEQLRRVNAAEISPGEALSRVLEAKVSLNEVRNLLRQMGELHEKRNILRRYDAICARVPDPADEPAASVLKEQLTASLERLESFLRQHFRPPSQGASPPTALPSGYEPGACGA